MARLFDEPVDRQRYRDCHHGGEDTRQDRCSTELWPVNKIVARGETLHDPSHPRHHDQVRQIECVASVAHVGQALVYPPCPEGATELAAHQSADNEEEANRFKLILIDLEKEEE